MSDGIKVGGPGRVGGPSRTTKKQGKSGSSFAEALTSLSSAEDTPEMESMASVDSIGGLLSLQEAPDAEDRPARRRAVTHGSSLLDGLEEIRLGLSSEPKLNWLSCSADSRAGRTGNPKVS